MYDSTPWGYIHQKKATEQALSEKNMLATENDTLKKIIKKLLNKEELSKSDLDFLKSKQFV